MNHQSLPLIGKNTPAVSNQHAESHGRGVQYSLSDNETNWEEEIRCRKKRKDHQGETHYQYHRGLSAACEDRRRKKTYYRYVRR